MLAVETALMEQFIDLGKGEKPDPYDASGIVWDDRCPLDLPHREKFEEMISGYVNFLDSRCELLRTNYGHPEDPLTIR
jgi:hypothetical protein